MGFAHRGNSLAEQPLALKIQVAAKQAGKENNQHNEGDNHVYPVLFKNKAYKGE